MKRLLVRVLAWTGITLFALCAARAQDSVDVTFRYQNNAVTGVTLPGEFNGWNNSAWPMTDLGGGLWTRTARLSLGGNPAPGAFVPGAWQYKFYYAGAGSWPNDPLNHHVNPADNNNSFIYTRDPTIYQVLPNQRQPVVATATPVISAYIFPKVGATLDTSSIVLTIDGVAASGLGASYDPATKLFSTAAPAPLANGSHTLILRARTFSGGSSTDTVTFVTQSGYVQITSQGGYTTRATRKTLYGAAQGAGVDSVKLVRNGTDTVAVGVALGKFSVTVDLVEGVNTFRALADSAGTLVSSQPCALTRFVNHAPTAAIRFQDIGTGVILIANGSTDPDTGQSGTLTFAWKEEPGNPSVIGGVTGATAPQVTIPRPTVAGTYMFSLVAADGDGNRDTTRSYFSLTPAGTFSGATLASSPDWVREGRMYELFFKMHTPSGTINAALPDLNRIAAMGFNILWLMPVMKNASPMNNGTGTGYNITDFTTVAPEYGSNLDLQNFIARAHQLGMRVILDITPNHTSSSHPFVLDARAFRESSRYWTYYQHQFITYTGPGIGELGQSMTSDGFVYYGGFGEALLNYNWADVDARQYMIDVYKYWIAAIGADGFRFDVYWGPFTRTNSPGGGESEMGQPVRQALKHLRPDIQILAEASGTGTGTERLYADYAGAGGPGGADAAYDWALKGTVQDVNLWNQSPTTRVNNIDVRLRNNSGTQGMGFMPGPNATFLRFLENHDEDRVAYVYGNGVDAATARARTMPVATAVNLAVGLPLVYAGQEVGRGYGLTNFDQRRRGVVDFTDPAGQILMPHYQKLAQIKKQYPCFTTQSMVRVTTDNTGVYAYTRPLTGQNGVVVANLDGAPHSVVVTLAASGSPAPILGVSDGMAYVATDLYNGNATQSVTFTGGVASLGVNLAAYGTAVFVLDTVARTLVLPSLTSVGEGTSDGTPDAFALNQNYPNPFNPVTVISYQLPGRAYVRLNVYDLLGRLVATLAEGEQSAGHHIAEWDARARASGVYFCRLQAGSSNRTIKMILQR